MLGREVLKCFLGAHGWEALGLAFRRAEGNNLQKVDICDGTQVERVLAQFRPDVVVHCAAQRWPDLVDKQREKTEALNVSATELLAQLCSKASIYLLYISTDYVFDGKAPPYFPGSATNPLNVYGVTKRDGENMVLRYPAVGAVLRVPVLYGPLEYIEESTVTALFPKVKDSSKQAKISDYEQRFPTHVTNCAQVCLGLAERQLKSGDATGIWHCSSHEPFTKYTMTLMMAEVYGLSSDHLIPVKEPLPGATRPYNCSLDTSATEKLVPLRIIPFREGIKAVLDPFLKK